MFLGKVDGRGTIFLCSTLAGEKVLFQRTEKNRKVSSAVMKFWAVSALSSPIDQRLPSWSLLCLHMILPRRVKPLLWCWFYSWKHVSHSMLSCHLHCLSLSFLSSLFFDGWACFLAAVEWERVVLILSSSLDGLQQKWPERTGPSYQVVQSRFCPGRTWWIKSNGVCQHRHRHGIPKNEAGGKKFMWERNGMIEKKILWVIVTVTKPSWFLIQ